MADVKKVARLLISKSPVSFIASVDAEGFPHTKAMLPPRKVLGLKTFYFVTSASTLRVGHFRANPKASVYFCDPQHYVGVLLRGNMQVLEDAKSKAMLWLDSDIVYYRGGLLDPDYCVLRFSAVAGRLCRVSCSVDFAL